MEKVVSFKVVEGLSEFISFKSISADSKYENDCIACAKWLSEYLKSFGVKTELIYTPKGKPIVYGRIGSGVTRTLIYGHYDVQPPEPLDLWNSDPFKLTKKDGRVYARGAQDNKGQLWYLIQAVKSKAQALKEEIIFLIEGEEETGSGGLSEILPSIKDKIKADTLLVCDTGTLDERVGALTMGLRGIAHLEVQLIGPSKDLHSGVHGGVAPNPALALVRMLSSLHDEAGRISIPNFYDALVEPSKEEIELAEKFPITESMYKSLTGVMPFGGEKGKSIALRRGFLPTIEINGLRSGHIEEGSKTIIPSIANAKLSIRLGFDQDPNEILELVTNYLKLQTPLGLTFKVIDSCAAGRALRVPINSTALNRARNALIKTTGADPLYIWEGASIPVLVSLAEISGSVPVLVGFGLEEDCIHAPNESFKISQWEKGYKFALEFFS